MGSELEDLVTRQLHRARGGFEQLEAFVLLAEQRCCGDDDGSVGAAVEVCVQAATQRGDVTAELPHLAPLFRIEAPSRGRTEVRKQPQDLGLRADAPPHRYQLHLPPIGTVADGLEGFSSVSAKRRAGAVERCQPLLYRRA